MFAIFLVEGMNPFYQNISSFPTVIFTFLLAIIVLYWLVAVLGIVSLEILDFDLPGSEDLAGGAESISNPDTMAGLFMRYGLYGVPVTIIISFITLFGWFICYYLVHFLMPLIPGGVFRFLLGIPIWLVSLYLAVRLTGYAIKPIRTLFRNAQQQTVKHIVGKTAIVRTSRVDSEFGEAILEDGGAGLILHVRSFGDDRFVRGDRVVLLEYLKDTGVYRVISEQEFLKGSKA